MGGGIDVGFGGFRTAQDVLVDAGRYAVRAADRLDGLDRLAGECVRCPSLPLDRFGRAWTETAAAFKTLTDALADRVSATAAAYGQIDDEAAARFGGAPDARP